MEWKPPLQRWGSYDQLMRNKTLTPPVEAAANEFRALEQEVENLKEVAIKQNKVLEGLGDRLLALPSKATGTTKARDIPILDLKQLQGLSAITQLQIFFESVEECTEEDLRRVQIAKRRVSPELAALIHNRQTTLRCNTWRELKQLLEAEFATEIDFDRAWQEIDSAKYDWIDSPQAFTHAFKCQYALLESRFPLEKLPHCDKTIKRKLWQGLTPETKTKLEGFLGEDYPLQKFIDRVEHARQWLEATQATTLHRVKSEPVKQNESTQRPNVPPNDMAKPNATSREPSELEQLQKQVKELTEQVGRLRTPARPPPFNRYCSYCRSNTHYYRDCRIRPPRGACYDCKRDGCWRRKEGCPGPSANRT